MKCQNCGVPLEDDVLFCRECGNKVEKKVLFCRACGAKIADGAQFCSECGTKTSISHKPHAEAVQVSKAKIADKTPITKNEPGENSTHKNAPRKKGMYAKKSQSASFSEKIKSMAISAWDGMDVFCRTVTVVCAVVVLLLLVAMLTHKGFAIAFSLLQITGLAVATLMHKEIIKSPKPYLKFIILAIAIVFTILNFMSFSWGTKEPTLVQTKPTVSSNSQNNENNAEQIDWENIALSHVLPKPQSDMMEILLNSEDFLSVNICDISENDYLEYVRWCQDEYGFTVESECANYFFWAYNHSGYYLTLFYNKTAKELNLNLNAPSESAENTDKVVDTTEQAEDVLEDIPSINANTEYESQNIGKDEVSVPATAYDYKYNDYQEVQVSLEEAGFTNITTAIQYDIVWGWTSEGEVESVSIDGRTNYEEGDVFKIDVPVVITYHMKEEDDPNNDSAALPSSASHQETEIHSVSTESAPALIEATVPLQTEPTENNSMGIRLPDEDSKLGKDLDTKGTYTIYYINVDGIRNVPKLKKWNNITATDGVAEYLDQLKSDGYIVKITNTSHKTPYAGYNLYETDFEVIKGEISWTMYLCIQDEKYTEYELDINIP